MNIIKELRETQGITQSELARRTGLPQTSITRWENNRNEINSSAIVILARYFSVTSDELLGLADYSENTSSSCDLDAVELEIIEKYRLLSEERRSLVLTEVNTLLEMDNKETL